MGRGNPSEEYQGKNLGRTLTILAVSQENYRYARCVAPFGAPKRA